VAAGDEVVSDGVRLQVEPGADIAVSFHVVGSAVLARHEQALQRSYATPPGTGAHGGDVGGGAFTETIDSWLGVTAVDVAAPAGVGAVAALGDSLTDGTGATFGAHRRWTDRLADRFDGRAAVINAGISANLAARGYAPAGHPAALDLPVGAADRLVPDVLLRSGVTDLVVYAGINDILFGLDPDPAASVIAAHQRIISAAHAAGLRVIGATLTPASFVDPSQEAARQRVNRWIRTSAGYDRVVDFDAAVADPAMPRRLRPAFDDDGIHLTDAGYAALAASVDESLLQGHACA
jgi:lysophospholipase L1-like esterase